MKVGVLGEYGITYSIPAYAVAVCGTSRTKVRWKEKKDRI